MSRRLVGRPALLGRLARTPALGPPAPNDPQHYRTRDEFVDRLLHDFRDGGADLFEGLRLEHPVFYARLVAHALDALPTSDAQLAAVTDAELAAMVAFYRAQAADPAAVPADPDPAAPPSPPEPENAS